MDLHAYLIVLAAVAYGPVWLVVGYALGRWGVPPVVDKLRGR